VNLYGSLSTKYKMGKLINLINQKFGRLTVIERGENDKYKNARWWCRCDCGNPELVLATSTSLLSGHTQSCGCYRLEQLKNACKKQNTYDLSGDYGIGYTTKGEKFYFDLEDYELIKNYYWAFDKDGYVYTTINNMRLSLHRFVMNISDDDSYVDHIKHNNYDNRKIYLRIVTPSQNQMNRRKTSKNTSGVVGVSWINERHKWLAQIVVNGKAFNLGRYNNFNDAVKVRRDAENKYFGEYSYNNSK
jgi:hypothetical protein